MRLKLSENLSSEWVYINSSLTNPKRKIYIQKKAY